MKDKFKEIDIKELFHRLASELHRFVSNPTFTEIINYKLMLLWLAYIIGYTSVALIGISALNDLSIEIDLTQKLLILLITMVGLLGGGLFIFCFEATLTFNRLIAFQKPHTRRLIIPADTLEDFD